MVDLGAFQKALGLAMGFTENFRGDTRALKNACSVKTPPTPKKPN